MNEIATMTDHSVAVYPTHDLAEAAVKSLSDSGYDMKKLSIIGQNYATEEHPVGFVNLGDRMLFWGKLGAFWGSIWGLLFGSAMIFVPGIGFIMFAGWLVAALEGAALGGGIAAVGAALLSIGIPKDSVVHYESALKAGSFLLIAHGSDVEVQRAKDLLTTSAATRVDSYSTKQPVGLL
jgi:hypothetical protein